jgi:CheY-like chemotaxis protein
MTGLRVLVVDDDRDGADALALLVGLRGHAVQTCRSGPEASADYHSFRPHVIFLDLGLPGLDGFQVARQIRQEFDLSQPVIVAYTGYVDQPYRAQARQHFDYYLVKPADPADLKKILTSVAGTITATEES